MELVLLSFAGRRARSSETGEPQERKSLSAALEDAGLSVKPVVVADAAPERESPGGGGAATLKFTRPSREAGAMPPPLPGAASRAADEIVLEAREIEPPGAADEDDIWSLEMSPPPPWLRPQRATLRSRWRSALVTAGAWVATLVITGLIVGGTAYALARYAPAQLLAIKS